MSDMSHVYNAYAAVHDSEKRNNLSEVRDQISEMTLTQLTDLDLYEVAEEVLEEVFSKGTGVAEAQELVESIFKKAYEGDVSPVRADKLERLGEAFATAFEKVKERSLRTAVESYSEYRRNKERLEKWNDSNSTGSVNQKLHDRVVGEDRLVVKTGLKDMIEAASPAAQEEKLRKDDKLFGSPNSYESRKKAEVLAAMKKQGRKLSDKEKSKIADKVVKDKGDTSKSDDRYAYEAYTVTNADKKANTPAYQGYKAGKKNVKTGEPLYKAADHLKKEELEASGVFTAEEIKKILWTDFEEGYQRDPEGGEEKERQRRRSQKGGDRTEKVRGERTPMPPRGDKRREDFEKWYAANVR